MSTALEKAKAENVRLKDQAAKRRKQNKSAMQSVLTEGVGQLGEAFGAATSALVDAKWAGEKTQATFGSSPVPVMPAIGASLALVSLALVKPAPVIASGIGRFGTQALWIGSYLALREKADDALNDGQ